MVYLDFVAERHRVWEKRQRGEAGPWTGDPILASRKFTNVFRAIDYGSQYLITELLEGEPRDVLMRCFLYRHTGRPEVWDYAEMMLGRWPVVEDLPELLPLWQEYRGEWKAIKCGVKGQKPTAGGRSRMGRKSTRSMFTGAYLVFPQSDTPGSDKLEAVVNLTRRLFEPSSPTDILGDFLRAPTQAERFEVLRRNPGVANFMSMQILTDWGYTAHAGEDREDEFVVAGPGAERGAAALASGAKPLAVIEWAVEAIRGMPDAPRLALPGGGYRLPSYMDAQNTLCEFSKYVRYMGRPPATKAYRPAHPGPLPEPRIPMHWKGTGS